MYQILSKKEDGKKVHIMYQLNNALDVDNLEKLNKLGKTSMTRSGSSEQPSYKIKNKKTGLEITGKLGDTYLFCTLGDDASSLQSDIEDALNKLD